MIMSAKPSQIVVCEPHGRWSAAFREERAEFQGRVQQTISWTETQELFQVAPASVVVLDLSTAALSTWMQRCWDSMIDFPELRFVAAGGSDVWEWEVDLRHAGFMHVVDSPRRVGRVAGQIASYLEDHPPLYPTLRQQLLDRLPWPSMEVRF